MKYEIHFLPYTESKWSSKWWTLYGQKCVLHYINMFFEDPGSRSGPTCWYKKPPLIWEDFLLDPGVWLLGFDNSATRILVRSDTDVWRVCLGLSSKSTPKVINCVEFRVNHVFIELDLCTGDCPAGILSFELQWRKLYPTAYSRGIPDIYMLPSLWQSEKYLHIDAKVKCPETFFSFLFYLCSGRLLSGFP